LDYVDPIGPKPETISIVVPPGETAVGNTAGSKTRTISPDIGSALNASPEQWVAQRVPGFKSRPLDWSDARIELVRSHVTRPRPSVAADRARVKRDPTGVYVPVRSAQKVRSASTVATGDFTLPNQEIGAPGDEPTSQAVGSRRVGFDDTVAAIGAGSVEPAMPVWAQRSTGKPRITGADDLVAALSKATNAEAVVGVLMGQATNLTQVASSLPSPVIQVIQQIHTEAGRAAEAESEQYAQANEASGVRGRRHQRGNPRSTTRVVRGFTGIRPSRSTGGSAGTGRVSALAKRLQELIRMAENQNRAGARREVRLAEDSHVAKAEGVGASVGEGAGQETTMDVHALTQEVTEAVQRELELRRERRLEDPNGRSIWWE
jgi:hypothetical protein